jgi:hypothetical protein
MIGLSTREIVVYGLVSIKKKIWESVIFTEKQDNLDFLIPKVFLLNDFPPITSLVFNSK